jgi:hypothetical protein
MKVRAKFKVDEIKRHLYGKEEMRTVVLSPVYGNSDAGHENTNFWKATPSGKVELGCVNLAAADAFELGKEYYIDFIKAE